VCGSSKATFVRAEIWIAAKQNGERATPRERLRIARANRYRGDPGNARDRKNRVKSKEGRSHKGVLGLIAPRRHPSLRGRAKEQWGGNPAAKRGGSPSGNTPATPADLMAQG